MNDIIDAAIPNIAGDQNAIQDKLLRYYRANGAVSLDLRDAEREFLVSKGEVSRAVQDMWERYLRVTLGYTGTLDDMQVKYWTSVLSSGFPVATGGVITTVGNDKIHTFNASGTLVVTKGSGNCQYLVIGGGASGNLGGGAAGGFRTNAPAFDYPLAPGTYTITVGAGGEISLAGNPSTFGTITAAGGGVGGAFSDTATGVGGNGGSGGGGGCNATNPYTARAGGVGNTPVTAPSQGRNGGTGGTGAGGGGGGGAGAVGVNGTSGNVGGAGGAGLANSITGAAVTRAGGGGGAGFTTRGAGGTGGGGAGAQGSTLAAVAGAANTGSGGGGGAQLPAAKGGSGVVIVRYQYQ